MMAAHGELPAQRGPDRRPERRGEDDRRRGTAARHLGGHGNADTIARGLSGFEPAGSAVTAGRIMLERLRALAAKRIDFAFEPTMASRSFAPWLRELRVSGYLIRLVFLWLPTADLAVQRVRERVRAGGDDVPEETVRRRFGRGIRNFLDLYCPLARRMRQLGNVAIPQKAFLAVLGDREGDEGE